MLNDVRVTASCKTVKTSVRKMNLVAKLVRKKSVSSALATLMFCNKKVAVVLTKLLKSAMHNVHYRYSLDVNSMYVDSVLIGKAPSLKRFSPRARGRASRIIKHYANVTVILKVI